MGGPENISHEDILWYLKIILKIFGVMVLWCHYDDKFLKGIERQVQNGNFRWWYWRGFDDVVDDGDAAVDDDDDDGDDDDAVDDDDEGEETGRRR